MTYDAYVLEVYGMPHLLCRCIRREGAEAAIKEAKARMTPMQEPEPIWFYIKESNDTIVA